MSHFDISQMAPCTAHSLDQNLYNHAPFNIRPVWQPKGKSVRVALILYLYIEWFEAYPPSDAIFDQRFKAGLASHYPYLRANAQFEYGNRVGVFRILDAIDALGLKPCVVLNASACEIYPDLIEKLKARDVDFIAHGEYASRMITSKMTAADEEKLIKRSLDILEASTGVRPRGWMSQDYGQSQNSLQLLDAAGLEFICDYSNDEHPYRLNTNNRLVSVPNCAEWNDVEMMVHRKLPAKVYAQAVRDAFNGLWQDGNGNTRVFALHLHPWISGQPSRFAAIAEMLHEIASRDRVWHAQPSEVASLCAI